ncbi:MAG: prepilin-type N-terminal cleavage/methylation protein [Akkermansiaceae bacterium]|nr:prepilin-type N-terminal cleavage/methylation protein [Akkermansiaceae bacterium]
MKTRFHSSKKPGGFTLIELMVAMAITAIIVGVLVSITGVAVDAWQRGRSEVRASRQAKSLLDTMAKDFESSVSRRGNKFEWLYASVLSSMPGPASNKSANASELMFFTAATDRYLGDVGGTGDKGGDVSCVAYHLEYQDPVKGSASGDTNGSTFVMYRLLVDPDETFSTLLGKDSLKSAFATYETKIKDVENFVCENVCQFTLTFEVEVTQKGSGAAVTKVPVRVTLGDNATATEFKISGEGVITDASGAKMEPNVTDDELKAGRVIGAEIGITVLSDSAITRLGQTGLKQEVRDKIMAQESFHYSRSVVIPSM